MKWLVSLLLILAAMNVARADDQQARDHLADADEALAEAEDVLRELVGETGDAAKILREAKRKAKADTDRSRGPAMIEGTLRAAAGVLGFGPAVDAISGTVAAAGTAAAAWAIGKRRGSAQAQSARRREDDDDDPDDRTGTRGARFRGDGRRGRGEGGREARNQAGAPVSNGNGYAGQSGHGYDRPNRSGEYDALPATASQRAKAVQS